jgi:hypothetical protein
MSKRSRLVDFSERAYGWLLAAYPRAHRCEFGTEMRRAFRDLCRNAVRSRGVWGLVEVWLAVVIDTGTSALRERGGCMSILKNVLHREFSAGPTLRKIAQAAFFGSALLVFVLAIHKLAALKLTEGELFLGVLLTMQLTMTMIVLGVLTIARPELAIHGNAK